MGRHLRTRYSVSEVKEIFARYLSHERGLEQGLAFLTLGRRQFFNLVKVYRADPKDFSLESTRTAPPRTIDSQSETQIMRELKKEAAIIRRASNPGKFYNYSYLKERLAKKHEVFVSLPTIIRRAKKMGFTRSAHSARLLIEKF